MLRSLISIFSIMVASAAPAQDAPNTILVMDGSGSMWGQIDGVNKIVIAREVVGDLLDGFPDDQNLGLTVYGHRERGNCADIETIVAPGPATSGLIRDAVNNINPRGKTPMTDAITMAAQALRYTEERATVILVSDGIETCNPDPCAAARALEEAGIDFTAHVVGFDVTDPEALAQMQCIAGETGGEFFTAANANELTQALSAVVVEPVYVPQTVQFVGVLKQGGPEISEPIRWNIQPESGANFDGAGPGFAIGLPHGGYDVAGVRETDGAEARLAFEVSAHESDVGQRVEVIFPEPQPDPTEVSFRAVIGTEQGELIETPVFWTVTSDEGSVVIDDEASNPLPSLLEQGSHSVTAYWAEQEVQSQPRQFIVTGDPREIIVVFEPPAVTASLGAPASAVLGSTIEVVWNGPGNAKDYIGIGKLGATGSAQWANYTYVTEGSPLMLLMPPESGPYEIAYFDGATGAPLGAVSIQSLPADVSVTAPSEAAVSDMIEVAWVGPDTPGDFIGIGKPGATGSGQWANFTYTKEGSPLQLMAPAEAGDYVIKYFLDQDNTPLFEVPITILATTVTMDVPAVATGGTTIDIPWTGPDHPGDFIGIGKVGQTGSGRWQSYVATERGSPAQLRIPTDGGDYLVQYFLDQRNTPVLNVPVSVITPAASLNAPETAAPGATIEVAWTGPNYDGDYVGIGKVGQTGSGQWAAYGLTADGAILTITVPDEPGDYVIRYFVDADRTAIASRPIAIQ